MLKDGKNLSIGVFDSGVGGISVLAELISLLPNEQYIYYGDSQNAPYGERGTDEVKKLSLRVVEFLQQKGIKALVVACNTATSAAIEEIRQKLNIPVVGMEPALKPAVELNTNGKILVMATPVTLREKKFNSLIERFYDIAQVIKLPCPGLVDIIEKTGGKSEELEHYLRYIFSTVPMHQVDRIVLGCTHYVFIKSKITYLLGDKIKLIDGNQGTANQVKRLLIEHHLCTHSIKAHKKETEVCIINSSNRLNMEILSKNLLIEGLNHLNWKGNLKYTGGEVLNGNCEISCI